ncbi:mitogen-activated protein kinase kinase kinase, putative [Bodo saltans]|uniref:Mitogen-activated protein kinase kinase kinase, putative n=1 Tax=Bodo saltans TaxID=75058 RepID=A0A0S4JCI8_BODSA|nr:mitogen-activated protein kinase kinase kinase, putative [Bodo saltans]|eukprot:CUG86885.1 mitogen-activated protein kinase kinase kinase, putative [Bodo saltans]
MSVTMDPHQTRLIRLLENGCEDVPMLQEAASSCLQNTEQRELRKPLQDSEEADGPEVARVSLSNPGPLDFVVESSQNMTALEISVLTQNNTAVEVLLKGGAQADMVSGLTCTCLCKVCYTFPGNIKMIRTLLEGGANPDATTNNDTNSASCLIISVVKNNVEAVKALLEYGGDVSYEWKGQNALSMALDFNKDEIVTLLENHEYRRAQDNRWRRFTDRKLLEENRELQRKALHKQIQLEDQRRSMLRRSHSKDPMMSQSGGTTGGGGGGARSTDAAHQGDSGPNPHYHISNPDLHNAVAAAMHAEMMTSPIKQQPLVSSSALASPMVVGHSPQPADDHNNQHSTNLAVGVSPSRAPQLFAAHQARTAASNSGIDETVVSSMSHMEWIIPPEDLQLLNPISSGAHGDVFSGKLTSIDEVVAVKRFPCSDAKSRECFRQELTMLSKFRHENIVMFKGAVITPDLCCMVQELCEENLLDRLARPTTIPWSQRLKWARDMAKAMNYLHTRVPQVVHRDLKSLNVLLDFNGTVKLCDFGMARLREHTYIATQHISGSPSWMAPEVLRGDDFDDKSDVYAYGVIMWELMMRRIPWPDKNMAQLVGLVGFGGHRLEVPAQPPEGSPKGYIALMKECFGDAPSRPTFKVIRAQIEAMLSSGEMEVVQPPSAYTLP